MTSQVTISVGELLDKFSILIIKKDRIFDPEKQNNILNEITALQNLYTNLINDPFIDQSYSELLKINNYLWFIESAKRECEQLGIKNIILKIINKDPLSNTEHTLISLFLLLARSVYLLNDERALIKKKINLYAKSDIIEEKLHL